MRSILYILLLLPLSSYGQAGKSMATSLGVRGSIDMPSLMSIQIDQANSHIIQFGNFKDLTHGLEIPSYLNIGVKSNVPWTVSVMTDTRHFSSVATLGSPNMPTSLISLKNAMSNEYVHLSNAPRTLLLNDNNRIENRYAIDMRIDPLINYYGGVYNFNMIFIVTPQ